MRVESSDHATSAFVDLAFRLNAADPQWVPPFRSEVKRSLSPAGTFRRHGELRCFLAEEGGVARARCVAMIDRRLSSDWTVGQVGFYESEPSAEASRAVLDAAMAWLKQKGVRQVLGPMNFSIWHAYRFMTRGFQTEAFLGEPRNPPHYPEQFAAYGFAPHARYFSWDLSEPHLRGMLAAARAMADPQALSAAGLTHRPIDLARFDEQISQVHRLLVEAFAENVAFTPIDLDEFLDLFGPMKALVDPDVVPIVWTPEGKAVGFGYLFPDHAAAIRRMNGGTGPWAKVRFRLARGRPDRLVFHTVAIEKAYRRKGMVEHVLSSLLQTALDHGFKRAVGALAKEGPTMYHKTGAPSREYVLYRREL